MILIVDSGATKSDWIALDEKGNQLFMTQTLGLSPEVLTRSVIEDRLANNFELSKNKEVVSRLYFYGAGCGVVMLLPLCRILPKIIARAGFLLCALTSDGYLCLTQTE